MTPSDGCFLASDPAHQPKRIRVASIRATTTLSKRQMKARRSVSWLVFANCDHSTRVGVSLLPPVTETDGGGATTFTRGSSLWKTVRGERTLAQILLSSPSHQSERSTAGSRRLRRWFVREDEAETKQPLEARISKGDVIGHRACK